MFKIDFKKFFPDFLITLVIFSIDRISKIYILKIAEKENLVDIYLTTYLNFYLIWNKGIAFGMLSYDESVIYNIITFIIVIITGVIMIMIVKSQGFKKYGLLLVLGGSISNVFDRIYYSAVPDFIDLHIMGFHWFIFNVADIFITLGIFCLIIEELMFDKKNEK